MRESDRERQHRAHTNTDKQHRHTDTQTHRHIDTQTHRHTDTQTHRHTQRELTVTRVQPELPVLATAPGIQRVVTDTRQTQSQKSAP